MLIDVWICINTTMLAIGVNKIIFDTVWWTHYHGIVNYLEGKYLMTSDFDVYRDDISSDISIMGL